MLLDNSKAFQSVTENATILLVTDKGDSSMEIPPSVSEVLSEFYEWAKEFYAEKNLEWPGSDDWEPLEE